eukprot:3268117-Prymnesium_polylepis.1
MSVIFSVNLLSYTWRQSRLRRLILRERVAKPTAVAKPVCGAAWPPKTAKTRPQPRGPWRGGWSGLLSVEDCRILSSRQSAMR